jgi:protein SCO1/2
MRRFIVGWLLLPALAAAAAPAVQYEQRIGQQLPMDCLVVDESGTARTLGSLFDGKPMVLYFNYFRCPELCSLVARGTVDALRELGPSVGRDFGVISLSIDPSDTSEIARTRHEEAVRLYGRTGAATGWHTLVGSSASIAALTSAAGFHYVYDAKSRQYVHPSGVLVVSPKGVVSRYFLGIDFLPKRLAGALQDARENRLGETSFNLLFICFDGDSPQGRYGRLIWGALWVSVTSTMIAVFGGIVWMLREERAARENEGGMA